MLPPGFRGLHVLAPDMRGYGRTTGWDDSYDGDVFPFRHTNLVRDALGLVSAFGYRTAAVVGRDAGSPVAGYCALIRPDVFRSVAMMTSPFVGPPALPFGTVEGTTQTRGNSSTRQHYPTTNWRSCRGRATLSVYYTTREAHDNMRNCPQGVHAFMRAYYHYKSAIGKQNKPFRLASLTAEETGQDADLLHYGSRQGHGGDGGIGDANGGGDRRLQVLSDNELAVYTAEYERTGFQGGFQAIGVRVPDSSPTCKHSAAVRSTYPRYSSAAKAIGAFFKSRCIGEDAGNCMHQMRGVHLIDGAGHWLEQEQPRASEQVAY